MTQDQPQIKLIQVQSHHQPVGVDVVRGAGDLLVLVQLLQDLLHLPHATRTQEKKKSHSHKQNLHTHRFSVL